jgi:hypothetical protein
MFILKITSFPKEWKKKILKAREKIINEIYRKWSDSNLDKCTYNHNLKDFIHIRFEGINETVNKAARTYQSTITMFQLTDILQKAKITGYEKPKQNKNQSKYTLFPVACQKCSAHRLAYGSAHSRQVNNCIYLTITHIFI